ncbi:MAG: CU044_2847 family protein [Pseudomonadota bacterium]
MGTTLQSILVGGKQVWVEVEATPVAGGKTSSTSTAETAVLAAELSSVDLSGPLRAILEPIHEGLKSLAPEEVEVEVSLGFKGEVGVFVARSEGSAAVKVTAKWKFTPR